MILISVFLSFVTILVWVLLQFKILSLKFLIVLSQVEFWVFNFGCFLSSLILSLFDFFVTIWISDSWQSLIFITILLFDFCPNLSFIFSSSHKLGFVKNDLLSFVTILVVDFVFFSLVPIWVKKKRKQIWKKKIVWQKKTITKSRSWSYSWSWSFSRSCSYSFLLLLLLHTSMQSKKCVNVP